MRSGAQACLCLALLAAAGCRSDRIYQGDTIRVIADAGPDLNQTGQGGPQHVQFRAWALNKNRLAEFEQFAGNAEGAQALADPERGLALLHLGVPFTQETRGRCYVGPGKRAILDPMTAAEDEQFEAVGFVVLFPAPRFAVIGFDKKQAEGHRRIDARHDVYFSLGANDVRPKPAE